jgi:SAM-dependent methyltransferase
MSSLNFAGRVFTAPPEIVARLTEAVTRWVEPHTPLAVLEIGCGTGEQLFSLAAAWPRARLTGIDISAPNIDRAWRAWRERGSCERLGFVAGDYVEQELGRFDLIISVSTLHLIDCPTARLFAKVARELKPNGLLIFTIPYGCFFNYALWSVRRLFRLLRSPATDRLILAVGKKLHQSGVSEELLRERVGYMYSLPHCYLGPSLKHLLSAQFGLELVGDWPLPHASLAQPKHRFCVYRKGDNVHGG